MILIGQLYMTLMPVIFAGIANMLFCKSPICHWANYPMDGGRVLADGQSLFGSNKTWKGFGGMIVFGAMFQILWGLIFSLFPQLTPWHLIYTYHANSLRLNMWLGSLLGLAYVLFELPNSFIKRRLAIEPGKLATNGWRPVFFILDQIDSLIGCALVVGLFSPLSWEIVIGLLLVGAGTHIVVNQLLYLVKWRRNRF